MQSGYHHTWGSVGVAVAPSVAQWVVVLKPKSQDPLQLSAADARLLARQLLEFAASLEKAHSTEAIANKSHSLF